MQMQPVFIISAARTPIGSFMGSLADMPAPHLGAVAIGAAMRRARVSPELIDEVVMGNVVSSGIGQAPARQAALRAGLPQSVPCTTVNKVCGSGLQAVIFGARAIALGDTNLAVCGGMESMSNVPYYLPAARKGLRMGHGEIVDGMVFDGIWDPYKNVHMGACGDLCAKEFGFTREQQDQYAAESYRRAVAAQINGCFEHEIVPVEVPQKRGDPVRVTLDEEPARGDTAKMNRLRPAFSPDGTITAANASKINDGASALVLASERAVRQHKLQPLARIVGYDGVAQAPEWFTTAPAAAIDKVLKRLDLRIDDIGLFEINEAFAVVAMHAIKQCKLDSAKVNVNGGAVALGHPIGCTGARIVTTLVHAMHEHQVSRGLATLCIGGGEALALVVERA